VRPRSLTFRLTAFFSVVSTAVLLAIGYLIGVAVEAHFVEQDRAELEGKLELVRHVLARVRSPSELATLPARMDDALTGHEGLSVAIRGRDGTLMYAAAPAPFPEPMLRGSAKGASQVRPEIVTWEQGDAGYRGMAADAPTAIPEMPPAIVAVAVNIDRHRVFMASFHRNLWLAILLGVVLTWALGWIAAQRGLAPIRDVAEVAQRVTASHLHDRLALDLVPAELVVLASSFNDMLTRLEDSFRRLSEFSSDLAHELRTPVTNLMTQTHVALSRSRSEDEYREVLYSSLEEYDRLARMVTDMLFLAKADNGLVVPRHEPVDLAVEVRALFEFFDALAEDRGVSLNMAGEGSVSGERLMLRRAISNLLANAIRHTEPGGRVDVRIQHPQPGQTVLSVENLGDTIPAEHLPHLFDRFYRVDPSRQKSTDGAGLGLAITKSIVAAHNGIVRVFSAQGVTRFEMIFSGVGTA
jgi:two-component system heavy metal sensor histidine kinase CusS